jgi:hypothetical protein
MKYGVAHPGTSMGQAQKCGGAKLINGILLITGSPIYSFYNNKSYSVFNIE